MIRAGNRLTLLETGGQYFSALLAELDQAQYEIHLESYLFRADATGQQVIDALIRAAGRGVVTRVLLDGIGARDLSAESRATMLLAGVKLVFFRPDRLRWRARLGLRKQRKRLRRLHRKLVLVDARVAFIGGINIIDDFDGGKLTAPRQDYMVQVEGPLLADMVSSAHRLWRRVQWSQLGRKGHHDVWRQPDVEVVGQQRAEFVERDNLKNRRAIESHYLQAIEQARHEIFIANAYFLPGVRFRHALIEAVRRGVRVVLMTQGYTDHLLYRAASRALYRHFLENGIEIFEYRVSELHAKVAVIDSHWATVGSSNIDPFSLLLAREANLVAHDTLLAQNLLISLEDLLREGGHRVQRMRWQHISRMTRVVSWLAYGLVRGLMGILGVAQGWDRKPQANSQVKSQTRSQTGATR